MRFDRRARPVMMIEEGGIGGVADYTVALVSALADRGQPVAVVTASDHAIPAHDGVEVLGWFHYLRPTSRISRALKRAHLGPIINGWSFLFTYLRCVVRARRCRLVHIQGGTSRPLTLFAVVLLRLLGRPVVHTPHNTFSRSGRDEWAGRGLERMSSVTIVHARADLANLALPEKSVVIPHGEYSTLAAAGASVDREQARERLGIAQGAPVTLVFGQLREDKGLADVLTAVANVPDMVVIIAGQDVGGLAAVAAALGSDGLRDKVAIREGFLSMDEAAEVFAAADTATLAYRQASQSGVLMLAYGFATPVVVYPTGGLPEAVVEGETGWVCARPDPASLTDTLRATADAGADECRRRGDAASRLADREYSWDAIAGRTLDVYDGLRSRSAAG